MPATLQREVPPHITIQLIETASDYTEATNPSILYVDFQVENYVRQSETWEISEAVKKNRREGKVPAERTQSYNNMEKVNHINVVTGKNHLFSMR